MAERTAAWAKSGGWVNPYQTDDNALVAMWDCEFVQNGKVEPVGSLRSDVITGLPMLTQNDGGLMAATSSVALDDSLYDLFLGENYAIQYCFKNTWSTSTIGRRMKCDGLFDFFGLTNSGLFAMTNCTVRDKSIGAQLNFKNPVADSANTATFSLDFEAGKIYTQMGGGAFNSRNLPIGENSPEKGSITFYANAPIYGFRIYSRPITVSEKDTFWNVDNQRFNT